MNSQRKTLIRFVMFSLGAILLIPLLAHVLQGGSEPHVMNDALFGSVLGRNVLYLSLPFAFFAGIAGLIQYRSQTWRRSGMLGPPWHDPRRCKE